MVKHYEQNITGPNNITKKAYGMMLEGLFIAFTLVMTEVPIISQKQQK